MSNEGRTHSTLRVRGCSSEPCVGGFELAVWCFVNVEVPKRLQEASAGNRETDFYELFVLFDVVPGNFALAPAIR